MCVLYTVHSHGCAYDANESPSPLRWWWWWWRRIQSAVVNRKRWVPFFRLNCRMHCARNSQPLARLHENFSLTVPQLSGKIAWETSHNANKNSYQSYANRLRKPVYLLNFVLIYVRLRVHSWFSHSFLLGRLPTETLLTHENDYMAAVRHAMHWHFTQNDDSSMLASRS